MIDLEELKDRVNQLVDFHEKKANYYLDWLEEIENEERTIGFKWHEVCNKDKNE